MSLSNSVEGPSEAAQATLPARRPIRLAYLVSHPIQYQAPLLRRIAQDPTIDLTVFFGSDASVKGYHDEGFGVAIKWDVPLLEGYRYEFLPVLRDTGTEGTFSPIVHGLYKRLAGTANGPAFDVLWVHGYTTALQLYGIACGKLAGIPVLTRSDSRIMGPPRSALKHGIKRFAFHLLGRLLDGALTVGQLNHEYIRLYFGDDLPLFLLPYAVDNEWFQQQARLAAPRRAELQAELAFDPARPVILFAGKMQTRKHFDDLIAAYARLSPAPGQDPHPYLVLVGDGEQRQSLERQAAATGFSSIRFCGFRNQQELPRFFDLATVFVSPAGDEPWGLVVNEVMNSARALILADQTGCIPDLLTDGVEGLVYKTRDIEALAQALKTVLGTPGLAVAMGRRAFERVQHFSFEQDLAGLRHALGVLCPGDHALRAAALTRNREGAHTR